MKTVIAILALAFLAIGPAAAESAKSFAPGHHDRIMIRHGLHSIRPSGYSAAIARSGIASCKMTPSIGSNLPCHGHCLSARIVAS